MALDSITKPVPPDHQRGRSWRVSVDGRAAEPVASVVIEHERLGRLTYGETPLGYDGWSFRELGGGGVVVVPFTLSGGQLFVGVVRQVRPNQGGEVWNAPRGFLDPGEDHAAAALRELAEEMGLRSDDVVRLPGEPGNPNSAFFETWGPGEGIGFFAVEVDAALTQRGPAGELGFRPGVLGDDEQARRSRMAESISHAVFLPWHEAAGLADMMTNAAVARLLARLRGQGRPVG
jgi:ADP-ribose pyrophosphatase YjhB (NUDIX family)